MSKELTGVEKLGVEHVLKSLKYLTQEERMNVMDAITKDHYCELCWTDISESGCFCAPGYDD